MPACFRRKQGEEKEKIMINLKKNSRKFKLKISKPPKSGKEKINCFVFFFAKEASLFNR